jgi:hypothetical protein
MPSKVITYWCVLSFPTFRFFLLHSSLHLSFLPFSNPSFHAAAVSNLPRVQNPPCPRWRNPLALSILHPRMALRTCNSSIQKYSTCVRVLVLSIFQQLMRIFARASEIEWLIKWRQLYAEEEASQLRLDAHAVGGNRQGQEIPKLSLAVAVRREYFRGSGSWNISLTFRWATLGVYAEY